jgi:membrane fusion protein, heavy metal efflux system
LKNRVFAWLSFTGHDRFARGLSVALIAATAALSLPGCSAKTDGGAPASSAPTGNVTLTAAQRQHIQLYAVQLSKFHGTIETTATVDFDNDRATGVLAPFSGPVSRLLVSVGDEVKAGDPLAAVYSPDFAAAISAYRKAIATARTARRLADLDKDLIEHQGVAQREAEQAQTDAANAEADREAALQTLVSLNVRPQTIKDIQEDRPVALPEGLIRAPIAGTVAERLITPGQLLQAGTTPCFTVANLARMWVMAQVFGSDVAGVSRGDSAEVLTGTGSASLPGTVDNIASLVDPNTRSVLVRVLVENPDRALKKQMYVRIAIHARRESTGILIANSAILRDDENLPFVYVARSDDGFARQPVTLGHHAGDQVEISAGLAPGDRIVVDGGIFVQFIQSQ